MMIAISVISGEMLNIIISTPDHRRRRRNDRRNALVQSLSQRVYVIGDPGKHLAVGSALEILHRHAVDLLRDLFPQTIAYLLRDADHNPALHEAEQRTAKIQSQHEQQNLSDLTEVDRAAALDLLASSPLYSSVVALPRIFGPMTLNTVEQAAKIMTAKIPNL